MPAGRPSTYSLEIAEAICLRMRSGESLRQICKDEGMPAYSTVMLWCEKDKEFSERYARAREALQEYWADEIVEISDEGSNDWMTVQKGDTEYNVVNHEAINRSRLRVDSRKWLMSKLAPKKYGDKITQEHVGENGGPPILQIIQREPKT